MHETWTDESNTVIKIDELIEYIKTMPIQEQNELLIELSKISYENNKITENHIKELKTFLEKRNLLSIEKKKVLDVKKVSNSYKKYVSEIVNEIFFNIDELLFLEFNDFILKTEEIDNDYLKTEIINNCSEIEHKEYDGAHGPNQYDWLKIRNYKEKFLRIQESRDTLQMPDQKIYHYSYDEYKFPKLVSLIDELLKENIEVLEELKNIDKNIQRKQLK